MWPWGHLAMGYVVFSIFTRLGLRKTPSDRGALLLAVATQLPDLIDKPLAWQFGLLSGGVGMAHSLLVGVPMAVIVGVVLVRSGQRELGAALSLGYTTHVLGDLIYSSLFSGSVLLSSFLWPLYTAPQSTPPGIGFRVWELLVKSWHRAHTPLGRIYLLLEATLLTATVVLWILDGTPGTGLWRALTRRQGENR